MNDAEFAQPVQSDPSPVDRRLKLRFLCLSLVVLVVDQWSKWAVHLHLPEHVPVPIVPGFLNLTHVKNPGVAFGLFAETGRSGGTWILTALGLAALSMVAVYFWKVPSSQRLLQTALALVLGGAVGNLIDRAWAGEVTDFIDAYYKSYHWHTFNVADSAITVGIVLIAIDTLLSLRTPQASPPVLPEGAGR